MKPEDDSILREVDTGNTPSLPGNHGILQEELARDWNF